MKPGGSLKHFMVAFALAFFIYVGFYSCDRHLRVRKGPWEVTFATNDSGQAELTVNQSALGISGVTILLRGETVTNSTLPATVVFDRPLRPVPFGKVIYDDLSYLPGAVTLDLLGHEVELLPRTLIVNRREVPWEPGKAIELPPAEKLAPESRPKKRR
jgi:hypothetical protein